MGGKKWKEERKGLYL